MINRIGKKNGVHRKTRYICKQCKCEIYSYVKRVYCSEMCYGLSQRGKHRIQYHSPEEREKKRQRMLGENNPMWKGGDSDKDRRNSVYKNWRIDVFERDGFTCQKCGFFNGIGKKRRDLNAHHIVGWTESIELRYEIENGITLCVSCHIKEHAGIGGRTRGEYSKTEQDKNTQST